MARLDVSSSDELRAEKILDDLGIAESDMDLDDLMEIVQTAFRSQRELDAKIALEPKKYSEQDLASPAGSAAEAYQQGCRQASETIASPWLSEDEV